MSFLLKKRNHRHGVGGGAQASRLRPPEFLRRAPIRGTGGRFPLSGGTQQQQQAMVTRQRPTTTTTNKDTASSVQQRTATLVTPHQQPQEVITMDEIMKDLQVLEDQQKQARVQLHTARQQKEQLEQEQDQLEFHLGELKYHGGQMSAEISRIQDMLTAASQKFVSTSDQTGKAHCNMSALIQNLEYVLHTKRIVLPYQRKQERAYVRLVQKAEQLDGHMASINGRLVQVEGVLNQLKKEEERLHRDMQHHLALQKSLRTQTAESQASIAKLQQELDSLMEEETEETTKHQDMVRHVQEYKSPHIDVIADLEAKEKTTTDSIQAILDEKAKVDDQLNQANVAITTASTREIDVLEKYQIASDSSGIVQTLALAQNHFQGLLQTEIDATKEAAACKDLLQKKIAGQHKTLHTVRQQIDDLEEKKLCTGLSKQEGQPTLSSLTAEASRYEAELASLKSDVAKLRGEVDGKRQEYQGACAQANDRVLVARQKVKNLEAEIGQVEESRKKCDLLVEAHQNGDPDGVSKIEEIKALRQEIQQLDKEFQSLETEEASIDEEPTPEDEEFERKAESILKEYPVLEDYEIGYMPDLKAKEQAKVDLDDLIQESKKRVRSAKKYCKEMEKDARKNAKEQETLQRQLEQEEKRKQDTRRRHEIRSQSSTSKDASESHRKASRSTESMDRHKSKQDLLDGKDPGGTGTTTFQTRVSSPERTDPTNKADYSSLRASKLTESVVHPSPPLYRKLLPTLDSTAKESPVAAPLSLKKVHWEEDKNPESSQAKVVSTGAVVARTKSFKGRALVSSLHRSSKETEQSKSRTEGDRTSSKVRSTDTEQKTKASKKSTRVSTKPSVAAKKTKGDDTRVRSDDPKKKHPSSNGSEKESSKRRSHRDAKSKSSDGTSGKRKSSDDKHKSSAGGKRKTSKRSRRHVSELEVGDQKTKKRRRNKTFGSSNPAGTHTSKAYSFGEDVGYNF